MKFKLLLLGTALLMTASVGTAQSAENTNLDTVLVTSTANYPDTFLANPVSEKLGAPTILTEKNSLPSEASETLSELDVEEAVIIGGPSVVSESVEQDIDSEVNTTTRLWGTTQVGTSSEVSGYFWTGSKEATLVQYPLESMDSYRALARASHESDENPLIISKPGTLSATALTEIERLGATEVEVYSTNSVNVTQDLKEIGVKEVNIESLDSLAEEDQNNTKVFVAAPEFRQALSAAASRGSTFIVQREDEVSEAVTAARQSENDKLYVTGQADLAARIAESLRQETDKQAVLIPGEPSKVSANLTGREAEEWSREQDQELSEWRQNAKTSPGLKKAANKSIERAKSSVDQNSSENARELLQDARDAYRDGDYFEARKLATRAHSTARSEEFRSMSRKEIREKVEQDREDFRQASDELSKLGQEQAEELRNAESMEERLEIIREYRQQRREVLKELKQKARENGRDVEKRQRSGGERFRQESGDSEDVGSSELSLEVEGNEVKAKAEYTAFTAGYTYETSFDGNGSPVEFDLRLNSPEGRAAQVVSDYRLERRERLGNGSYNVSARFVLDGEELESIQKQVKVPSQQEFESESEAAEESSSGEDNVVRYTDSGFMPRQITIEQGETVKWIDESSRSMWVGSDMHPTHRKYDGTSLREHCEGGESDTFDQCSVGDEYEFEFEKTGEFGYHNHRFDSHSGTVIVE
ncbi:MAG: cell wall-binding repeat-containing protein [Candidatus Nanohaloarchaea archaeon]